MSTAREWRGWTAALLALLSLGARGGAQSEPPKLDATVRVRVVSLWTEETLAGVSIWAGTEAPSRNDRLELFAERPFVPMKAIGPTLVTGADGAVELHVPAGMELLVAAKREHDLEQRVLRPLAPGEQRTLVFEFRVGRAIHHGLVLERASGRPVPDARVARIDTDGNEASVLRADAEGRFAFESGDSSPEVRVTADGFVPASARLGAPTPPERPVVVRLDRPATLRARVLDLDGSPLAEQRVEAIVKRYLLEQPTPSPEFFLPTHPAEAVRWSAVTDASGAFELALPPRVWVEVVLPEARPAWSELYSLAPGEVRELVLVPNARVALRGFALDQEGKPVAGLTLGARRFQREDWDELTAPRSSCTTSSDGAFRFDGLVPGTWFVGPVSNPEDLGFARGEQRVELPLDPRESSLTLRLERGKFLRGRLEPYERSSSTTTIAPRIEVRSPDGRLVREGRPDEGGRFSIGPLSDGEYLVGASRSVSSGEPILVRAGASDLVVHVPPLAGPVTVGARNGRGGFETTLLFPHGRPELTCEAWFCLGSCVGSRVQLETGAYDAVMTTDDRRLGLVEGIEPTPDGTFVSVELAPCASVRVVYTGPELFARVVALQGDAVYGSERATQHTASVLFVPPGRVRLEVFPLSTWDMLPSGAPLVRELMVALGEEPEVLVP